MARQQEVRIPITAADQASQVFRKVASNAEVLKAKLQEMYALGSAKSMTTADLSKRLLGGFTGGGLEKAVGLAGIARSNVQVSPLSDAGTASLVQRAVREHTDKLKAASEAMAEEAARAKQVAEASVGLKRLMDSYSRVLSAAELQAPMRGKGRVGSVAAATSFGAGAPGVLLGRDNTIRGAIADQREAALARSLLADTGKNMKGLEAKASSLSNVLSSGKLIAAAWGTSIFLAGKQALDAAVMVDRLNKAYTTIEGSQMGAQMQLDFMYQKTHELGLQFYDTAEASKNFFAAMRGTAIEGDANKIWEAVTKAGAALSLSSDDMESIFRSLGQMVSKGKVMAEELRGQLGERLPGAFQLAAKAMGVTTMELDKMLETGDVLADDLLPKLAVEIEKAFGAGAQQAAQGLQQNINRLSTEWERFKAAILNSEDVATVLRQLSGMLKQYNDFTKQYQDRRAIERSLEARGVQKMGFDESYDMDFGGMKRKYRIFYTDDQIEEERRFQEAKARKEKQARELAQAEEAIITAGRQVEAKRLGNTLSYQLKKLDKERDEDLKAIDRWIELGKKQNVDISHILKIREEVLTRHAEQREELANKESKKSDYRGPETIERNWAGEAIDELKKQAEGQEKKDFKQETRDLDMVADVMQELAEKTGQYHLAVGSVNELIDRQGELWRNAGVPQNYVDQLKEVRRLEASREGWAGAMLATQQYYSEATNMAEAYKGVVQNAFGGMEDAIVNACMTGRLSFTDMVNSMIADLMRLMVRQSITGPLAGALAQGIGSIFGGGAATASTNASSWAGNFNVGAGLQYTSTGIGHDGWGLVGGSRPSNGYRLVPSALFANAPRFHGGTGFVKPGEYPAILKAGERVLNPAETRAYQSRREPTVNVNIVNSTGQQAATRTRSDNHGNKTIDVYVGDMAAKQMATPGTTLNRAVSAQTGTKRPAIRR